MRSSRIRAAVLGALFSIVSAIGSAQTWDAATRATGWAKQDRDDSFTFLDPASRTLHSWARDGGLLRSISAGRVEGTPERWAVDPRNNAWIVSGTTLIHVDPTGRSLGSLRLPAEVGDLCWDAQGFILSYRTAEPYVEKREFRLGDVVWSFGAKPPKREGPALANRRPVVLDDSGNILMADGNTLNLSILEATSGRKLGETSFRLGGQPIPPLEGYAADRGPLAPWFGNAVVFASLNASQVPAAQRGSLQGQVLARLDLAKGQVEFLPTGLDEAHVLVGVLDFDAVFASPKGGLLLVKVK